MNLFTCIVTFIVTFLAVAQAANDRQILLRVRPVTRKQYESIMNIHNENSSMQEGRIISSAITGLSGLATGLKISNFLPNIFGSNNQNTKGSTAVEEYPLCTIDTNSINSHERTASNYLNINQLTSSAAQSTETTNNLPTVNCILVLDDTKDKPNEEPLLPDSPDDLEEPEDPELPEEPIGRPTKPPTYPYPPIYHPPLHPPTAQIPYGPFYYPYYSYSPPAYPSQTFYPMPHPPYDKYQIYEKEDETKEEDVQTTPSPSSTFDLQTLIRNKFEAIHSLTSTTTTTKKPSRKPSRRYRRRPTFYSQSRPLSRSVHSTSHSKSQKKKFTENMNERDNSFDYMGFGRFLNY